MPYYRCGDLNFRGGYIAGISSYDRTYAQVNKKYVEVSGTVSNLPAGCTGMRLKSLKNISFIYFNVHQSDADFETRLRINGVNAVPNFPLVTRVQYGVVPIGFYSVTPGDIIECWSKGAYSLHLIAAALQSDDNIVSV